MSWEPVIGLEIHVQLATESKIFSDCPIGFGAEPNTNIDPVSTGQPGVLPVLNQLAVKLAVKAGLALHCDLHETSIFARKHYFYPDLPKAYQISQYDKPYAEHGYLDIAIDGGKKRIGITRIHMEEDAGKSTHGESGDPYSYVDFNRAGSPLIEIVSEPDIRSATEAGAYMREMHTIIRCIEVSDADLEKGNFRCDANISVRKTGTEKFGTRTEIKNINSFRFVEKAINYEIERQVAVIEAGGSITQETRLWDTTKNKTIAMRDKEEAHDYRYFPDPDLPPLVIPAELIENTRIELPELPDSRRIRFQTDYQLSVGDIEALVQDKNIADYYETTVSLGADKKTAANWILNEVIAVLDSSISDFPISPDRLAQLIGLIQDGTISGKIAKNIFQKMLDNQSAPGTIVEAEGLVQISDSGEIEALVQKTIDAYPDERQRYLDGDKKLLGFFMGQIMKESGGKANPGLVRELLQSKLK